MMQYRQIAVATLALAFAAPVAAQVPGAAGYVTQGEFDAAREAARRREVELENRLNALDATRRADEAVRSLREQADRAQPGLTPVPGLRLKLDPGPYAAIPDAWLAESNERVRAAAANRR